MKYDADQIIKKLIKKPTFYDAKKHCVMLVEVMTDHRRGTICNFCIEAFISERTFHKWVINHPEFEEVYSYCKMVARSQWEQEGRDLKDHVLPMGQVSYAFEYWKLIGWSRFGVSKNPRVKLNLNADDTPDKHYKQLIKQATEGDFTASEIKQLMESINIGLSAHQVLTLQASINDLKSDLVIMKENSNGNYSVPAE